MGRVDETELKIKYRPRADRSIKKETLMERLKKLEGKRIPMEVIPLKVLSDVIEYFASEPNLFAVPDEVQIESLSRGMNKKFTLRVNVKFRRKLL